MQLYWLGSTNAQKPRLALELLGLPYTLTKVDLFNGEQHGEAFKKINPASQVPVLVDGDLTIAESNAIISYLGEKTGTLWPTDLRGRTQALQWLFFEAAQLASPANGWWFSERLGPKVGMPTNPAALALCKERIVRPMQTLNAHLATRQYMLGELSLVDAAFAPILAGLAATTFDWTDVPHAKAYVARMMERPAWAACAFDL